MRALPPVVPGPAARAAFGLLALRVVLAGVVEFAVREVLGEFDVLRLRFGFFAIDVSSLCTRFYRLVLLRDVAATHMPRQRTLHDA
jgi:hypothetical protein